MDKGLCSATVRCGYMHRALDSGGGRRKESGNAPRGNPGNNYQPHLEKPRCLGHIWHRLPSAGPRWMAGHRRHTTSQQGPGSSAGAPSSARAQAEQKEVDKKKENMNCKLALSDSSLRLCLHDNSTRVETNPG